jgi:Protein of unknown function (DUF2569).
MVLSLVQMLAEFRIYFEVFSQGAWELLATPGSPAYNPLWAPILIGEMAINFALFLSWIFIVFLFFSKKKLFPKWYVGILLFTFVFILVDALIIKSVMSDDPIFDPETKMKLFRTLIAILIWGPYMRLSKRVKATFVK